jgi:hypothetical protein
MTKEEQRELVKKVLATAAYETLSALDEGKIHWHEGPPETLKEKIQNLTYSLREIDFSRQTRDELLGTLRVIRESLEQLTA